MRIGINNRVHNPANYEMTTIYDLEGTNHVVANTLRRVILELVPTFAFDLNVLEACTSQTYYPDEVQLRLRNLPVLCTNDRDTLKHVIELEKRANVKANEREETEMERRYQELLEAEQRANNFTMSISFENKSSGIYAVTTDDAKFFEKGSPVPNPYRHAPLLLLKLKPGEVLKASCVARLDIPMRDAVFKPAHVTYESNPEETAFKLRVQSHCQLPEDEIMQRACLIIIDKCKQLEAVMVARISAAQTGALTEGNLYIENEGHTFGNYLTDKLQDHPKVASAGYTVPHPFDKRVHLFYKTDGTSILDILKDVFARCEAEMRDLAQQLARLEPQKTEAAPPKKEAKEPRKASKTSSAKK